LRFELDDRRFEGVEADLYHGPGGRELGNGEEKNRFPVHNYLLEVILSLNKINIVKLV